MVDLSRRHRRPVRAGAAFAMTLQVACLSAIEGPPTVRRDPGQLRWMTSSDGAGGGDRALGVVWAGDGIVAVGTSRNDEGNPNLWMAKHGREGEPGWERIVDPGPEQRLFAAAVAMDFRGDFVVCGGKMTDEDQNWDIWVAKVDPRGRIRWEAIHRGEFSGQDEAIGVDVAPSGDLVVVGYEQTGETDTRAWLARFDGQGEPLWQVIYDGEYGGLDVATEVAWAPDGDILVAGYDTVAPNGQETAVAVRRFSGEGELRWRWSALGPAGSLNRATSIDVTQEGDAVVAGWMSVDGETTDTWVARLDPEGHPRWQRRHSGADGLADQANDVVVDRDGDIIVAGFESFSGEGFDIWVRKFTGDGIELWTYRHRGENQGDDAAMAVTVDPFGTVYVVGSIFIDRWQTTDDEGNTLFEYDYDFWLASLTG